MKKFSRPLVGCINLLGFLLTCYFFCILFSFRNRNIKFIGQELQSIHKRKIFLLHDEAKNISSGATTKAMKKAFTFIYGKGGCLFAVKRTTAPISATFFLQWYIFGNNTYNVRFMSNLFFKIFKYFFGVF